MSDPTEKDAQIRGELDDLAEPSFDVCLCGHYRSIHDDEGRCTARRGRANWCRCGHYIKDENAR